MRAFALRQEYADDETFASTIAVPGTGETISIHERLVDGDGVIVTDDIGIAAALELSHVLDEVELPPEAAPAPLSDKLSREELNNRAATVGVTNPEELPNKPAVIDAIETAEGGAE